LELFVTRGPRSGWKLISVSKERNIEPRNKATDADTPKQQENTNQARLEVFLGSMGSITSRELTQSLDITSRR
jgi:hypothetical protein